MHPWAYDRIPAFRSCVCHKARSWRPDPVGCEGEPPEVAGVTHMAPPASPLSDGS